MSPYPNNPTPSTITTLQQQALQIHSSCPMLHRNILLRLLPLPLPLVLMLMSPLSMELGMCLGVSVMAIFLGSKTMLMLGWPIKVSQWMVLRRTWIQKLLRETPMELYIKWKDNKHRTVNPGLIVMVNGILVGTIEPAINQPRPACLPDQTLLLSTNNSIFAIHILNGKFCRIIWPLKILGTMFIPCFTKTQTTLANSTTINVIYPTMNHLRSRPSRLQAAVIASPCP